MVTWFPAEAVVQAAQVLPVSVVGIRGTSVAVGGTGVAVGGTGVSVGGTGVAVGGTGVAVGGTGVSVGGTGVAVGGTGVAVGGTSVAVGGTGVAVGGTGVSVGGTGVAVGGTGVSVGGTGVAVGQMAGAGPEITPVLYWTPFPPVFMAAVTLVTWMGPGQELASMVTKKVPPFATPLSHLIPVTPVVGSALLRSTTLLGLEATTFTQLGRAKTQWLRSLVLSSSLATL